MKRAWLFGSIALLLGSGLVGGTASASGDCAAGLEQSGLLCYPPCPGGFTGVGPVCWQKCPSGFPDQGAFCGKPAPYGRGGGYPWQFGDGLNLDDAKRRCERDKGKGGCEQNGLLIYPKCKAGFHNVACCICSPNCTAGMTDIGVSCAKKTHGRGVGRALKSVTDTLDAIGKALKAEIARLGRNLQALGKEILRGLEKLGKDIAKGLLHDPFYLYIAANRAALMGGAKPLTAAEKTALSKHYPKRILDKVLVTENPTWTGFFNFSAGATTYGRLVVVRKGQRSVTLLKHELVHVCQYDKFGLQGFANRYADQYVDGGFKYDKIKFEIEAFKFAGGHGFPGMNGPVSALLGYCRM